MAQIQKGTTYITGDQVTAANLNALADSAILLAGAITDQTAKAVPLAADTVLIHSAADTALRKSTLTQVFANATGIPLTTGVTGTLPAANGGTGVANSSTITLAGNLTHAGAFTQSFTATGNTALTLPTTGTLATLAGTEALSNKTITASSFSGTTGNFSSTLFAGGVTTLRGANVAISNASGFLVVGSSDAAGADLGGSVGFTANTTSLANYPMGNISARLVATGAGAYASYMAFATTDGSGTVAERMRLTSTGLNSTAVGASTPSTGAFTTLSATPGSGVSGLTVTGNGAGFFADFVATNLADSGIRIRNTGTGGRSYNLSTATDASGNIPGAGLYLYDSTGAKLVWSADTNSRFNVYNGLAVIGALSATGVVSIDAGATNNLLTLNSSNTTSGFSSVRFRSGATKYAWQISAQNNVDNVFEITPSTAVGGTTFTTPVVQVATTGLAVTGALSATGAVTVGANNALKFGAQSTLLGDGTTTYFYSGGTGGYVWRNGNDTATLMAMANGGGLAVTGAVSSTGRYNGTNLTLLGNQINENVTNGLADIAINYGGYADGTTQFRRLKVFDGKNNEIATFASGSLAVTGALSATGSATITGGAAIGQPAFQATGNQASQLIANLTSSITTAGSSFGLRVAAGTNASDYALRVLNQAGTLDYLFVKGDGAVSMTGALAIGNTVNTVSPTSPNRTITMVIGGTTYYIHAKTTND